MPKRGEYYLPGLHTRISNNLSAECLPKQADLHIHTKASDGILTPEQAVDAALMLGLSAIAITDHDVYTASDSAYEYSQKNNLPIEIVRAVELSTSDGHVLAYNLQGTVYSGLPLAASIRAIHQQGGLAVAAHPGLPHVSSLSLAKIEQIITAEDPDLYFDGIEIHNATGKRMQRLDKSKLLFGYSEQKLNQFIIKHQHNPKLGAFVGGTDAHTYKIGETITIYSHDNVIEAIKRAETMVMATSANLVTDVTETTRLIYSIIRAKLLGSI